jgi:hypothetical protein
MIYKDISYFFQNLEKINNEDKKLLLRFIIF